jgi:hypothetical protein
MTTSFTNYGRLRLVAILNVFVALVPTLQVKGRQNDPLLDVTWWPHQYHSAVLIVAGTALIGISATYALRRLGVTQWWAYCICSAVVGAMPGIFYMAAIPADYIPDTPLKNMVLIGELSGIPLGALIGFIVRGATVKRRA